MKYTGDRALVLTAFPLGETQHVTPEGYLYCRAVPIARVGVQQYLNHELEPDAEGGPDGVIHVERRHEDVFHEDTIASFEGKPIVDDHPEEMLSPETVKQYQVGVTIHPRQGEGDMADHLIADLLIMDKDAIAAVRAGKREVSAGYGAEYESLSPGRARQHTIIGNHVALVKKGRCGPSCSIGDEDMVQKKKDEEKKPAKGFFQRLKAFMDSEGYTTGEEGAETVDEAVESESGAQEGKVGGDTHIHIHTGPNDSTTQAPTTDKKVKDKKTGDEDEGAEAEAEEEESEDNSMEARMIRLETGLAQLAEAVRKLAAAEAAETEEETEVEGEESETEDADTEEEGEAEAEGDVETEDADKDEDEEKEDKKKTDDSKPAKDKKTGDKKMKDKKATKDAAPSLALKTEFQQVRASAEILAPGLKLPTFDAAQPQRYTTDAMCLLRRRALAAHMKTPEGEEVTTMLNGGKPLQLQKLTCDAATVIFNSAVAFAQDRNSKPAQGQQRQRATKDHKAPATPGEFNKQASDFWNRGKPNKSA